MKAKHVALLALATSAGSAYAQSSVTLYGFVDEGLVYTNNQRGGSTVQTITGQNNTSRFGLQGAEDLGGGTKAIFKLENGFDPSTGKFLQGGRLFGREAWVGISSGYGTVTLGRQYEPVYDFVGTKSAVHEWSWFGTHPGDFDNMNSTARVNNAIKYASPAFSGFRVEGVFAPGGTAGNFGTNRVYSVGANYAHGPFSAAVAFLNLNNPSESGYDGTVTPGVSGYTSPVTSPVYSGYASARAVHVLATGGAYELGHATFGLVYTNTRFMDVLPTATTPFRGGSVTFNSYEANVRYDLTPVWRFAMSYDYTDAQSAHYGQFDVGADYVLTKRTDLNFVTVWQHASGIDSTGKPAVAAISSIGPSTTPNQVALRFSLRHRF
ncbi:porin [Paraburkholderia caballeronis]|uniref:Outer membrane protein (Porin) n=1 Tax=Paraburkholderia caballeronis TaxID=416943 RepID=A0A1H7QAP1_9BURK|nr:porin [Paraburkholderia caballeronis]PXW16364.1 putative porin [Paraburkholderia caballeronis]PXW94041.1 putative porin [Paraburkholderia caballeronis]RAJ89105.1 putative porin [Paraburkholderia caballeronis]SEE11259.1 Outer membrane protein (porin) [Paraburkholderia caballeronis]SEL44899.1 Outer membrane protein (porin) [Paraburkholderia caballeronis]